MATKTPEQIADELNAELASLKIEHNKVKTALSEAEKTVTNLTAANTTLKTEADAATAKVTILTGSLTELQKNFDELTEETSSEISNLSEELSKAKAIADIAEPSIKVGKKEYKVIGKKFTYRRKGSTESKEYTVAELLQDTALQSELVEKGVGFLVAK